MAEDHSENSQAEKPGLNGWWQGSGFQKGKTRIPLDRSIEHPFARCRGRGRGDSYDGLDARLINIVHDEFVFEVVSFHHRLLAITIHTLSIILE